MKTVLFLIAVHFSFALPRVSVAQENQWQPSKFPSFAITDAAIAKVYQNKRGATVLGIISFEREQLKKFRSATMTRTVKDPKTGKVSTEEYKQKFPYLEMTDNIVTTRVEVSLDHAKIWKIDGAQLSVAEAKNLLSSPRHCFVSKIHKSRVRDTDNTVDSFYQKFFSDELLVVWFDKSKAEVLPDKSKPDKTQTGDGPAGNNEQLDGSPSISSRRE